MEILHSQFNHRRSYTVRRYSLYPQRAILIRLPVTLHSINYLPSQIPFACLQPRRQGIYMYNVRRYNLCFPIELYLHFIN